MLTEFVIQRGNVVDIPSDLLLLKHAQKFYGADKTVSSLLISAHLCEEKELLLPLDEFAVFETKEVIASERVMFLGTPPLPEFTYDRMQWFARRSIEILSELALPVRVITTTIHGTGYGLDGGESLQRLIQGFQEGLADWRANGIERIVFVTLGERQERILSSVLENIIDRKSVELAIRSDVLRKRASDQEAVVNLRKTAIEEKSAETRTGQVPVPPDKKRVFVAMPFAEEFENVYEFGIYPAVRNCGFICERVDEAHFTGDILQRIREGIETAALVIADLTEARPNVYLEVGYAWGCGINVIFLAKKEEKLHFDVSTHRCIYYGKFSKLEKDLEQLIRGLDTAGEI